METGLPISAKTVSAHSRPLIAMELTPQGRRQARCRTGQAGRAANGGRPEMSLQGIENIQFGNGNGSIAAVAARCRRARDIRSQRSASCPVARKCHCKALKAFNQGMQIARPERRRPALVTRDIHSRQASSCPRMSSQRIEKPQSGNGNGSTGAAPSRRSGAGSRACRPSIPLPVRPHPLGGRLADERLELLLQGGGRGDRVGGAVLGAQAPAPARSG